ncbi:MAG TPA: protein kinase, partial [Pyrinomonadaceae bacterium]
MSLSVKKVVTPRKLIAEYESLCKKYLPFDSDDVWRFSRQVFTDDSDQGWKIHISATIHTAKTVLEKVAPLLNDQKVFFKAPKSLMELGKLNSGMFYGYSQIGKFITVYPRNEEEFVRLAETLHRLTVGFAAPVIPFDLRYEEDSNVYYRYGAFKNLEIKEADGKLTPAIFDLNGNLVPDIRNNEKGKPEWISNPLAVKKTKDESEMESPLKTTYRVFKSLSQRGKGGVYMALDFSSQQPRLCVIKEGYQNGEVNWLGRDGYDYVKREAEILERLSFVGLGLPEKYETFESGNNFYLVTEYLEGETLQDFLAKRKRRLPLKKVLEYSYKLALLIEKIHAANWVWHDCKPANIVITKNENLRLLDFEGAYQKNEVSHIVWGTDDFLPAEWKPDSQRKFPMSFDLFALGAVIYYLLCGRFYSNNDLAPL